MRHTIVSRKNRKRDDKVVPAFSVYFFYVCNTWDSKLLPIFRNQSAINLISSQLELARPFKARRLNKRTGSCHWFTVSEKLYCYEWTSIQNHVTICRLGGNINLVISEQKVVLKYIQKIRFESLLRVICFYRSSSIRLLSSSFRHLD